VWVTCALGRIWIRGGHLVRDRGGGPAVIFMPIKRMPRRVAVLCAVAFISPLKSDVGAA
jgi:hypothetical protein